MDIRVSGHQVDIGDALKTLCTDRLAAIADKYFNRAISAAVTVSRQARGHGFHIDCVMHVRHGVILKSEAEGFEAPIAFEEAAERIEKQLRRYKRRLKNHQASDASVVDGRSYVLQSSAEAEDEEPVGADNPLIIAETQMSIPDVAVGDAVMLLDFSSAPALMFRNTRTGSLNMIYRRTDGHIGWVEPAGL
jgi:ribosomal subunit interface protein